MPGIFKKMKKVRTMRVKNKKIGMDSSSAENDREVDYRKLFMDEKMREILRINPVIRAQEFKNVPVEDIIKFGGALFPHYIRDNFIDQKIKSKLKKHQKNTGIYLWKCGYNPEKCIGVGANGVVWLCKDQDGKKIAAKVTCDNKMLGLIKVRASRDEIGVSETIKKILEKDPEASSYFFISEHDAGSGDYGSDETGFGKRAIFRSDLADKGDLEHYKSEEILFDRLLEIICMAINILEALKRLHENGLSHNDVKPDNIFAITNKSQEAVREADKQSDDEEVKVKLADFGAMTRIDAKLKDQKIFANRYFCAPDMQLLLKDAIAKRDVYSLGAVLLYLLIGCNKSNAKKWAKKLENSRDIAKFCENCNGKNLFEKYGCDKPTSHERLIMISFLRIIQAMVASSYRRRLDVDESLEKLESLKRDAQR